MNTNHDSSVSSAHTGLLQAIAQGLTSAGWTVSVEPRLGSFVPDLVAKRADGSTFVLEVKTNEDTVHFAGLGQAAAYRQALTDQHGSTPTAIFASTGKASEEVEQLAHQLDVQLLTIEKREAAETASAIVDQINTLDTHRQHDVL